MLDRHAPEDSALYNFSVYLKKEIMSMFPSSSNIGVGVLSDVV